MFSSQCKRCTWLLWLNNRWYLFLISLGSFGWIWQSFITLHMLSKSTEEQALKEGQFGYLSRLWKFLTTDGGRDYLIIHFFSSETFLVNVRVPIYNQFVLVCLFFVLFLKWATVCATAVITLACSWILLLLAISNCQGVERACGVTALWEPCISKCAVFQVGEAFSISSCQSAGGGWEWRVCDFRWSKMVQNFLICSCLVPEIVSIVFQYNFKMKTNVCVTQKRLFIFLGDKEKNVWLVNFVHVLVFLDYEAQRSFQTPYANSSKQRDFSLQGSIKSQIVAVSTQAKRRPTPVMVGSRATYLSYTGIQSL